MRTAEILSRLECVKKTADGHIARCPAHDDKTPSLSVTEKGDRVLLKCFAGCTTESVCAAAGVKLADLFNGEKPRRNGSTAKPQIVATYDYTDEAGKLLLQAVRLAPKDFRQRAPDSTAPDGWRWKTEGVRRVLYRLPEIIRDVQRGLPIVVCEGEKDVAALVKLGLSATCNLGGAGKWRPEYSETLRGAQVFIIADRDAPGRKHAQEVAASLHSVASFVAVLELPDRGGETVKDAHDFISAGATAADVQTELEAAKEWTPQAATLPTAASSTAPSKGGDDLQRAIADVRPKVRLPGPDRLLSDFARELSEALYDKNIFTRNGEIVTLTDRDLRLMTPQSFRTWAENYFIGYRSKTIGENTFEFDVTMRDDEARGVLASPQFCDGLRRIRRVNHARLPIYDAQGKLALLPEGYHSGTQTLTLPTADYAREMPLAVAVETVNGLLAEFCFADGERSKAVAVAAMVGLFANQLLPDKSLRPCFVFVANAEGAGKTLLAQICMTPTLGEMPTGSKADDDDEMRKILLTAVREARTAIFLDNQKGRLSSEPLEAFLSAQIWTGRKLGVNESITAENLATVFVTGNGVTVSPDMRRRSLFVELHLEAERAEDREFKRLLDLPTLLAMRPKILAALWAMVKHWDASGRPSPSRSHSAFPSWANIVGGIVETAGFACPLETPHVAAAADPDGEDMRRLVSAMGGKDSPLAFSELVELARAHGCFEGVIGDQGELGRKEKSTLARLLTRYDRRLVANHRFIVEGKGKTRLYKAVVGHGDMVGHGVSVQQGNSLHTRDWPEHHADHADHTTAADIADFEMDFSQKS